MTREEDIKKAVEVLRKGGVILYPTDTVWGIGCDATNAEAGAKVYQKKQRDGLSPQLHQRPAEYEKGYLQQPLQ